MVERLAAAPLFQAESVDGLHRIARHGCEVRLSRGSVLFSEGAPAREFVFVLRGMATVIRKGRLVAVLGPGQHAGAVDVLARGSHRTTVNAVGDLHVLVFDAPSFYGLLDTTPGLAVRLASELAQRLHAVEP